MSAEIEAKRSHGPSEHGSDCSCPRCTGFQPGNDYGLLGGRPVESGVYSPLTLSKRAQEIEAWLWSIGPHLAPSDAAHVQLLALTFARLDRFDIMLGELDELIRHDGSIDEYLERTERRGRLSEDARRWGELARRLDNDLGLSSTARAQIEAARQPPGIPAHEVAELFSAFAKATLEFVDRARRDQFLARIHAVSAPLIGELPAATEVVDVVETHRETEVNP